MQFGAKHMGYRRFISIKFWVYGIRIQHADEQKNIREIEHSFVMRSAFNCLHKICLEYNE